MGFGKDLAMGVGYVAAGGLTLAATKNPYNANAAGTLGADVVKGIIDLVPDFKGGVVRTPSHIYGSAGKRKNDNWDTRPSSRRKIGDSTRADIGDVSGGEISYPKRPMAKGRTMKSRKGKKGTRKPKAKMNRKVAKKKVAKVRKQATKFVKKVVQKELDCALSESVYRRLYSGSIHPAVKSADADDGVSVVFTGHTVGGHNDTPNTEEALRWNFFTARKCLDAASVLYRGKTMAQNHEYTIGNFDNVKTEIQRLYASAEIEWYNNSRCDFEYELYEVTHKGSSDVRWWDALNKEKDGGLDIVISEYAGLPGLYASDAPMNNITPVPPAVDTQSYYQCKNRFVFGLGQHLGDYKRAFQNHSFKNVKSGLFRAGTHLKYFMKRGEMCYDMQKVMIYDAPSNNKNFIPEEDKFGTSLVLFLKCPLYGGFRYGGTVLPEEWSNNRGTFNLTNITDNYSIDCAVSEVWKIREPHVTTDTYKGEKVRIFKDLSLNKIKEVPEDNDIEYLTRNTHKVTPSVTAGIVQL